MSDDDLVRHIIDHYLAAAKLWEGCDWTTSFGPHELNLNGLTAKQSRLLAEATSGEESAVWEAASRWLEQVERHASESRSAASLAVELTGKQQWAAALAGANTACALEAQYHENLVWGPLRDLIAIAEKKGRDESVS